MKASHRNLWLEFAAIGFFLVSLVLLLAAVWFVFMFTVSRLLPQDFSLQANGVVVGVREAWVGALSMIVPAAALIATAWGLRSLVVEEGAPDE